MFKDMKLGMRLGIGFGTVLVLMAILVFFGVSRVSKLNESIDVVVKDRMTKVRQSNTLVDLLNQYGRVVRNIVLADDSAMMKSEDERRAPISAGVTANLDSLEKSVTDEEGRRILGKVTEVRTPYRECVERILAHAMANRDAEATAILFGEMRQIQGAYIGALQELAAYQEDLARKDGESAANLAKNTGYMLILLALSALVIGLGAAWIITRSITSPLSRCIAIADKVGKGQTDVEIVVDSRDEMGLLLGSLKNMVDAIRRMGGDATMLAKAGAEGRLATRADTSKHEGDFHRIISGFNDTLDAVVNPVNEAAQVLEKVAARDMTVRVVGDYKGDLGRIKVAVNQAVDNLDKALTQVGQATLQVSSAAQQISAGSQSLAQGSNEQASSLEEVSSSLEEMASMTRQNADNATQARSLSGEADQNARAGAEAMSRMNTAIVKIKDSSDQTAKIVKTIDEIAMQTNLLALNAAVEAARAGEAGRGFAVVAEEVRNLAQRSAQAAKSTADMIGESVKNADDGVKIAQEVSRSFDSIAGSSRKVNELIGEIASASKEQSQGIDQVNTAVSQMDKVTQQTAANAEESASSAEELSSQAEELQSMVEQFRITASSSGTGIVQSGNGAPRPTTLHPVPRRVVHAVRQSVVVDPEDVIPMNDATLREF